MSDMNPLLAAAIARTDRAKLVEGKAFLLAVSALIFGMAAGCGGGGTGTPNADGGLQGDGGALDGGATTLSWYRDALPVVQTRCMGCHIESGIAPFSLANFAEAKSRASAISSAVSAGIMPPWPPDDSCQPIAHSRALPPQEREILLKWIEQGAVEGDPADAPVTPPPPPGLPTVDLQLDAGVDYTPDATAADDYHCAIVDPGLAMDVDMTGFAVIADTPSQVHHVLLFQATAAEAAARDAQEPAPGWSCFGGPEAGDGRVLAGWAPGTPPTVYPEGTGIQVKAGNVFIMQTHFHPELTPLPDRSEIQLMFGSVPVNAAQVLPLVDTAFAIPAGAIAHRTETSFGPAPLGGTLYGVFPHMHTLGRSIRAWVRRPDGSESCLVRVPEWNFDWQQFYFLADPAGFKINAGDTLHLECIWDNPTSREVRWGEGTQDEMCLAFLYLTL